MQFFMHFDRVLCEKRYKELQAKYALCQKLLRVNIKVKIMEKFEIKGILCSHCLKILRDTLKFKKILSQYILKRWTKKARAENVKDRCGHDIKVDVRLHQTSRYKSLMAIFKAVACRASESKETNNLTVEKADELIANIESMLSTKFNMPFSNTIEQEGPPDTCPESFEVDGVADTNIVQAKGLKEESALARDEGGQKVVWSLRWQRKIKQVHIMLLKLPCLLLLNLLPYFQRVLLNHVPCFHRVFLNRLLYFQ
ncbi:hypothetical protein ACSBR1_002140 [Camellia fascicularis]